MSEQIYVLYHKNCLDGFCAAVAAWKRFGDAAFYIPAVYNKKPPVEPVEGENVLYLVDFSYPLATLIELKQQFTRVVVIDHHQSSYDDFLTDLFKLIHPRIAQYPLLLKLGVKWLRHNPTCIADYCHRVGVDVPLFDMSKSGAYLAWEYFRPMEDIPELVLLIQDYDLWRFDDPRSKAFNEGLRFSGYANSFEYYDNLIRCPSEIANVVNKGHVLLDYVAQIAYYYKQTGILQLIPDENGLTAAIYNSIDNINLVAEHIYTSVPGVDYVISYYINSEGCAKLSFRSPKSCTISMATVAKQWHPKAGGRQHTAGALLGFDDTHRFIQYLQYEKVIVDLSNDGS